MKIIKRNHWFLGVVTVMAMLGAGPAFSKAELPFFASISAKPNVLILLDTSGSMAWNTYDSNNADTGKSRMDIVKKVLIGGRVPVLYNNQQVYLGKTTGEYNAYDELYAKGVLQDILLLRWTNSRYELDTKANYLTYGPLGNNTRTYWFIFKSHYDHSYDACISNTTGQTTVANAIYGFSKFLRDNNNAATATLVTAHTNPADIYNDCLTSTAQATYLNRKVYQAASSGTPTFKNHLLENYGQYENLRIARVKNIPKTVPCYTQGTTKYACYKPAAFPADLVSGADADSAQDKFVIWDATDYVNNTAAMVSASMGLYNFILYYQARNSGKSNYNSFIQYSNSENLCGDGPSYLTNCSNDGKANRALYQLVPDTSSNIILTVKPRPYSGYGSPAHSWTDAQISANIYSNLDQALEVDAWGPQEKPDGIIGPEFIKSGGVESETIPIREKLGYTPNDVGWSTSCLNSPDWCHIFDDNNGNFNGLHYTAQDRDDPGIMDIYDVRYGLMIFDTADNGDFPGHGGGDLIYNLSEGSTNNIYLQEIIKCGDLNGNGHIADCTGSTDCYTCPSASSSTPIAGALRDAFSYLYNYYFTPATSTQNGGTAGSTESINRCYKCDYANLTGFGTTPSTNPTSPDPFGVWNTSQYPLNHNGHVLLNDPYYYYQCRSNNVILLTDGGQNLGEPCVNGSSGTNWSCPNSQYQIDTSHDTNDGTNNYLTPTKGIQAKYIHYFVHPSNVIGTYSEGSWLPTKVYVIGFSMSSSASGYDTYAQNMVDGMAAASHIASDPNDVTTAFYANTETELISQFNMIMKEIMKGVFSRSAPAVNTDLTAGAAGYFDVGVGDEPLWRGHLAFIDFGNTVENLQNGEMADITAVLDGASVLNARTSSREIFTSLYNSTNHKWGRVNFVSGSAGTLISKLFNGYPNYISVYDQNGDTVLNNTDASMLINFVRVEDGSTYSDDTERTWRLGAIYHSTPVAAGAPPQGALANDNSYQAFATKYAGAPELLYVGALDGMLHAFFFQDPDKVITPPSNGSRSTMEEAWAYVPNYVLPGLYHLRLGEQEIYVDGDPNVAVMRVNVPVAEQPGGTVDYCSKPKTWCWQTILFGGLRDGGPAYYSLNVTPDLVTTSGSAGDSVTIRWEFTDPDDGGTIDPALGNSWSLPYADELRYQDGSTLDTRLALIFGGGTSPNGTAYVGSWLYILDADTGTPIKTFLVPSTDQYCNLGPGEMLTSANFRTKCTMTVANHNQVPGDVMANDVDYDGFPDWGYFGDLQGRIWKLNVHDPNPAHWGICLFYDTGDTGYDNLSDPGTDCDGDLRDYALTDSPDCVDAAKRRPIMYRPDTTPAPEAKGWLVYVGTGHVEGGSELIDNVHHDHVFALLDKDNIDECNYAELWPGNPGTDSGWPIELAIGEKLISPPLVVGQGEVDFQTFIPGNQANVCVPGTTYSWKVNYNTGVGMVELSAGVYARNKAQAGFPGKSLVIGNIQFEFSPPTAGSSGGGKLTATNRSANPFQGFYYWWIK